MSIAAFLSNNYTQSTSTLATATPVAAPSTNTPSLTGAPISIGSFDFSDFGIPATIKYGSKQSLGVHKLIGGNRVFDVMGSDPDAIVWSGIFLGGNASDSRNQLNLLCEGGKIQPLLWGSNNIDVIIRSVEFTESFSLINYTITCEVVTVNPATNAQPTLLQSVSQDVGSASSLTNPTQIATDLATAQGLLSAATSLPGSSAATTAILGALQTVQSDISSVASAAHATVSAFSPILSAVGMVKSIANVTNAFQTLSTVSATGAYLGRAINNITANGLTTLPTPASIQVEGSSSDFSVNGNFYLALLL